MLSQCCIRIHCVTLLCIVFFAGIAHGQDTSSWVQTFYSSRSAAIRCMASQQLGSYYNRHKQTARGIFWAEKGLPLARKAGNDSLLWEQYDLLADLQDNAMHFDQSISYMLQSLDLKKKHSNWKEIAGTYNDLGVVSGEQTDLVAQASYYIAAKKIYDEIGDVDEGLKVAGNLAGTYYRQGNYEQAIQAYRPLLPQLNEARHQRLLYNAYVRITLCFAGLKKPDSAFYYSELETRTAAAIKDHAASFDAWCRRAYLCSEFENYQVYKQAIDSLMRYAALAKNEVNWGDYYSSLGMYQLKATRQYNEAVKNLYRSYDLARIHSDKSSALGTLINIGAAYNAAKDPANAYRVMQEAYALKDSIISDEGRRQLTEMQTKYETEKKEAQIRMLDKDNTLKKQTSYFLIAGVLLLFIVIASLVRNNKLKQKINGKLATLNSALEEANQSKAKLFSILSHDLRSPVSNLYSYLQLRKIAPQMLSEDRRLEQEEQLSESAGHLLNTMEDILIWSKSQLDSFVPDKTDLALLPLVQEAVSMYQSVLLAKQIDVLLPDKDKIVFSDEHMLQTIIRNLIANAARYTPEGGVLRVSFTNSDTAVSIFNSGTPIAPDVAGRLFNWSRISSNSTGYGLKISKALADKLGIEIRVVPQHDGNLFTLSFNE